VNRVEFLTVFLHVLHRVGLVKFKRISRLGVDIDAHHLEAGPVVTHGGPTSAAEQIQ
jgi:hypothetical protein